MTALEFNIDRPLFHEGFIQPKLDGIRCLAMPNHNKTQVSLLSRTKKEFKYVQHINKQCLEIYNSNDELFVLDGELYIHEAHFYEFIGYIKRDSPCAASVNVEFHVYDVIFPTKTSMKFADRFEFLKTLNFSDKIKLVETMRFDNIAMMQELHQRNIDNNYEGSMLRNASYHYEYNRSFGLLKYKPSFDEDFEIIGVHAGKKKMNQCAIFECITPAGKTFDCVLNAPYNELRKILLNKEDYIGRYLSVKHYGYTKNGVPMRLRGLKIKDEYDI